MKDLWDLRNSHSQTCASVLDMVSTLLKDYSRNIRLARDRARALERAVLKKSTPLGPYRSLCLGS